MHWGSVQVNVVANVFLLLGWVHGRNLTAARHRYAQHCDSENEHSAVTAKTSTVL